MKTFGLLSEPSFVNVHLIQQIFLFYYDSKFSSSDSNIKITGRWSE